jgi:YegS/Rv2252/BmrU family lipid kinase
MKYLFILNPKSGLTKRAEKLIHQIDKIFSISGHEYEFAFTTGPGDATQIARNGAAEGFDLITAVGGDGTVNEVASGLINTNVILGIIPLGSGNGIARSLDIPVNVKKSIRLLLNFRSRKIDTGLINDLPFIGVSGMGYDANIGAKFQEFGIRGPIPYFLIGIREYIGYKPVSISLELEGKTKKFSPLLIAFANTRQYGIGAIIAPQALPDDGYLDICIIQPVSITRAIRLMQKLFTGSIHKANEYTHMRVRSMCIKTATDETHIHTDGEPKTVSGDLNICIKEKSLQVCVGN